MADIKPAVYPAPPTPPPRRVKSGHFDLHRFKIERAPINSLQVSNRPLRKKDEALIEADAECMRRHEMPMPIIALRDGRVLHGDHTVAAYRLLGETEALVIFVADRSEAAIAAAKLWLNQRFNAGENDKGAVKDTIKTIFEVDPDWLGATFMTMSQIEFSVLDTALPPLLNDEPDASKPGVPTVTRPGDIFCAFGHRWMCGNSRSLEDTVRLTAGEIAQLFAGDPPFGCSVSSISRSHVEWQDGSALSADEMLTLHLDYLAAFLPHVRPGALVYLFMDAKGLLALLQAVKDAGLDLKTVCTWNKEKTGPGGLYANQTEFIVVARHGKAPKGQGRLRRSKRSTLWSAPGYATFRPDRTQALKDHACTKPGSICMDLMLDASERGDLVLDPFGGSGSMTVAAHQIGRRCYSMELEPRFVDVAIRRFHELTGEYPVHEETGLPFDELARMRGVDITTTAAAPRRLILEGGHG